jgi:hypothetical protein
VLTAGLAETVKSSKNIVKVSVAVPMPVVVSVPLMVKVKGFEVEGDSPESVMTLVVGMVG